MASIDLEGELLWKRHLGSRKRDRGVSIAIAPDHSVQVLGAVEAEIEGYCEISSQDMIWASLDPSNGEVIRVRQYGGSGRDIPQAIAVGGAGEVYLAGGTDRGLLGGGGKPHGAEAEFILRACPSLVE